jgi:malate dehydrogenase
MEEGAGSGLRPVPCRAKGGAPGFKVAVVGAAGGIGQSLSLLMKMNPLVSVLHLYDVVNTPGVTADVSHMDTSAVVRPTYLLPTVTDCDAPATTDIIMS